MRLRVGLTILVLLFVCAAVPGWIVSVAPGSPSPFDCSLRAPDGTYQDRLPPSADHWFGTDAQGCDQFSRVIHGARHSLVVGLGTAIVVAALGASLGIAAGWRGGWVDTLVRRMGDVVLGVPLVVGMILILSITVTEQTSIIGTVGAFAVLLWPTTARLTRSATRTVCEEDFIEACRAMGASGPTICARHVFPNVLPSLAAFTATMAGLLIGAEAALSYLGLGPGRSVVSWGRMLDDAQVYYARSPHLLLFPALFLSLAIASLLIIGDAVAEPSTASLRG